MQLSSTLQHSFCLSSSAAARQRAAVTAAGHRSWRRCLSRTSSLVLLAPHRTLVDDKQMGEHLARYSKYQPSPLSMQHFIEFGRSGSPKSSFLFLRHELPVRLANIMREIQYLPGELRETHGCAQINQHYLQSFRDILTFVRSDINPDDKDVMKDFTDQLMRIRERHADLVTIMAKAVMEVKDQYTTGPEERRITKLPKFERNIQYFLDRLYTSRISTRMLINQHTLLFGGDAREVESGLHVGAIDPSCQILSLVERAFENARFLAEQYYMNSPQLVLHSYDMTTDPPSDVMSEVEPNPNIVCVQVPSHVYHVLFELFKNAMRATVEHCGEDAAHLPPITVHVVKSKEDVSIKISDRGGGIPKRLIEMVFQYLYTTAPNPVLALKSEEMSAAEVQFGAQSVPLAGYGYGLPLSRLYARYLSGDLKLFSMDGYGTDAVLHFQASPTEAKERLPVWHESGSKRIYEAQLARTTWTPSGGESHRSAQGGSGGSATSKSSSSNGKDLKKTMPT